MMRLSGSLLKRTRGRSALLAPFPAIVGTVHGVRQAFHSVDSFGHATSSVVSGGILAALGATLATMLLIVSSAAVWELLSQVDRREPGRDAPNRGGRRPLTRTFGADADGRRGIPPGHN